MNKACGTCKYWIECSHNHGSSMMGWCSIWKNIDGKDLTRDSDLCENWVDADDFEFGEPMHKENLPNFPLIEGETYLIPLKLIKRERRFDGGRGTEYYVFGMNDWCKLSISDYALPKIKEYEDD